MLTDSEVRDAARAAVTIAADQHRTARVAADRTLAYYLRGAIAHGLPVDEVCQLSQLDRDAVQQLLQEDEAA